MKKLLVLAIAAGLSATAAADATLYGQLHASYDALSADGADDVNSVASNSSRIGVKGSAELNAGLKAIYQAEWGIDTGGANNSVTAATRVGGGGDAFSKRNQVVGIAGGFGAILIGRHDTPHKIVGRKADLFWSTQLGQNRNVTNPGVWDLRVNNVLAYQSPKMGGFQALAAYVTDLSNDIDTDPATAGNQGIAGSTGDKGDNTAFSINGIYNAGPLMVGASYESHDLGGISPNVTRDSSRLMGSYKFGNAKVVGFYQTEDNGGLQSDADVIGVGASFKVSPSGTIKGQIYQRDIDGTNVDPQMVAVGYDHKLGKKTEVYAQYATIDNGGKLGGAGHGESLTATTAGGDTDGFSLGVRHKF